jgi:hypothetical protein
VVKENITNALQLVEPSEILAIVSEAGAAVVVVVVVVVVNISVSPRYAFKTT